jgi:hypothetical protein
MISRNRLFLFLFLTVSQTQFLFSGEEASYHPLGKWRLVTSGFGYRDNPLSGGRDPEFHWGVDMDAEIGDSVFAWRSGVVIFTGYNKTSGNMVNLQHAQDFISKYHHLKKIIVKEGDTVEAGQLIALAGKSGRVTGSHLHFSIVKSGEQVDPLPYLKAASFISQPLAAPAKKEITIYKHFSIRSYPADGNIVIDGENYGQTPLEVKLSYGEHFIEISAEGYEYFVSRIWIDRNFDGIYTASLTLKKSSP